MAGIFPLTSQPVPSVSTPSEPLSLSRLDEDLRFILWSRESVCSYTGSKTPSGPNRRQFVNWERVAAKSLVTPGRHCRHPGACRRPGLRHTDGSAQPGCSEFGAFQASGASPSHGVFSQTSKCTLMGS